MSRRLLLLPIVCAVAACTDQVLTTEPMLAGPRFEIADAARMYKAGFYWLPPMVAAPAYAGTFDPALSPTVEICELANGACGTVIASFSTTGETGSETIRLDADEEHYLVDWHTDRFELSTSAIYRVSIRAGVQSVLVGFADVQPVSRGSGLRNVDSNEYIGLVDGRTLPIRFRIETGIVGAVEVGPSEVETTPGATHQFEAIVYDLHGSVMSTGVTWASSDETVATVDATGLVQSLADGLTTISATAERISGSATLFVVRPGVALSAGANHNCTLSRDGYAFCWGRGDLGQLGEGSTVDRSRPVSVAGGLSYVAIAGGQTHTCALTRDREAYCWGSNVAGQLGDGGAANVLCANGQPCRPAPTAVDGGRAYSRIAAGGRNTCALATSGEVFCWGEGSFGALGNGSVTSSAVPVPVSGGHTFASIATGNDFACGVTRDGAGYCWGTNGNGQLGTGSATTSLTPAAVAGGLGFATIVASQLHACGLTVDGAAYCWGSGGAGRLGNGSTSSQMSPMAVSGTLVFASISAGYQHTCGVTVEGTGYCWGSNTSGRLGDGTQTARSVPTLVAGNLTWQSISAGQSHTCGVTTDERLYCWGLGLFGQLGGGTTPNAQLTPVEVAALP